MWTVEGKTPHKWVLVLLAAFVVIVHLNNVRADEDDGDDGDDTGTIVVINMI
jgi:hypothetical protein